MVRPWHVLTRHLSLSLPQRLIRGTYSENLIGTGIDLPRQKKTGKKKIYDDSKYANNLAVLKQNCDFLKKATIDFRESHDLSNQMAMDNRQNSLSNITL